MYYVEMKKYNPQFLGMIGNGTLRNLNPKYYSSNIKP